MQQPSEILVEHDMNNMLLYSPDQFSLKPDRVSSLSAIPKKNPCSRIAVTCVQSVSSSGPGENLGDHPGNFDGLETSSL